MRNYLTLREFINRLEELSNNGRNDSMSVHIHIEGYMGQDCYGQDDTVDVKNAYIAQYNNCGTFDESDDSYEFIEIIG